MVDKFGQFPRFSGQIGTKFVSFADVHGPATSTHGESFDCGGGATKISGYKLATIKSSPTPDWGNKPQMIISIAEYYGYLD